MGGKNIISSILLREEGVIEMSTEVRWEGKGCGRNGGIGELDPSFERKETR